MSKKFFESHGFTGGGLGAIALNANAAQLLESAKRAANPQPPATPAAIPPAEPTPEQLLEARRAAEKKGADMVERVTKIILESAAVDATKATISSAVDALFAWVDGGDTSYDALDGYVQAAAGISDDDEDPTDDQIDAYNTVWGYVADAMSAFGISDDDIESLADDGDDDTGASVAAELAEIDQDDRDETEAAFVLAETNSDDMLTEAFKKVVRNGEVTLIRKPLHKRRLSSAQKAALKKARMKANTGSAKLARKKSMKLRMRRFGR